MNANIYHLLFNIRLLYGKRFCQYFNDDITESEERDAKIESNVTSNLKQVYQTSIEAEIK